MRHKIWRFKSKSLDRFQWVLWCPEDNGYTTADTFKILTMRKCAGCGKG